MAKERYHANPKLGRAKAKAFYKKHIALIKKQCTERSLVIRSMAAFYGCAITGAVEKLVFHHLNAASKKFSVSLAGNRSWDTIFREMDKCVVVTRSMHRKIHAALAGKRVKDPTPEFKNFMWKYYGMTISEDGYGYKIIDGDLRSAA
jgi:hypothetical protein